MRKKNDIIEKKMNDIIQYANLSINFINKNEKEVEKSIKDNSYTLNIEEIKETLNFIKITIEKWLNNYQTSNDIMGISLKEYKLIKKKIIDLVDNSLLINGIHANGINSNLLYIGDKLSDAITTGGNIDNIDINKVFTLFVDSIDGMINDDFYQEDRNVLINLKELIINWQEEYRKDNKVSLITTDNINKIYKSVVKICDKYKMIEDENKNYAENIQYCYAKLEAIRRKDIER